MIVVFVRKYIVVVYGHEVVVHQFKTTSAKQRKKESTKWYQYKKKCKNQYVLLSIAFPKWRFIPIKWHKFQYQNCFFNGVGKHLFRFYFRQNEFYWFRAKNCQINCELLCQHWRHIYSNKFF